LLFETGELRRLSDGIAPYLAAKTPNGLLAGESPGPLFAYDPSGDRRLVGQLPGNAESLGWSRGRVVYSGSDGLPVIMDTSTREIVRRLEYRAPEKWAGVEGPGQVGTLFISSPTGRYALLDLDQGMPLLEGVTDATSESLDVRDGFALVGSNGRSRVLDLRIFDEPYCALMQRVWSEAPGIWEDGAIVIRGPPDDHPCSTHDRHEDTPRRR
jgi:hypothetical protein